MHLTVDVTCPSCGARVLHVKVGATGETTRDLGDALAEIVEVIESGAPITGSLRGRHRCGAPVLRLVRGGGG